MKFYVQQYPVLYCDYVQVTSAGLLLLIFHWVNRSSCTGMTYDRHLIWCLVNSYVMSFPDDCSMHYNPDSLTMLVRLIFTP